MISQSSGLFGENNARSSNRRRNQRQMPRQERQAPSPAPRGLRWVAQEEAGVAGLSALEILGQRFARGELDAAEYEEKRRLIVNA